MGISRYNSEGYFDPVPQMAVAAIEKEEKEELHKWRPLVYICSPFSGDIEGLWRSMSLVQKPIPKLSEITPKASLVEALAKIELS